MSQKSFFAYSFLALLLIAASTAGCGGSSSPAEGADNDSDNSETETEQPATDSCGAKIVPVPKGCDGCHGAPPVLGGHPQNKKCFQCHGDVIDADFNPVQAALHKNGKIDVTVEGCGSCHGDKADGAPPKDLRGECSAANAGVGSHAAHAGMCADCHAVPDKTDAEGHIDSDGKAEVKFSGTAAADGASPKYENKTCSSVYCHGATLTGGTNKTPAWGDASGKAKECGACHALASPTGDVNADCNSCHSTTVDKDKKIIQGGAHINGVKDVKSAN